MEFPYFVFKNTSVDDGVESWFRRYDEETDEYIDRALSEIDNVIVEFVLVEEGVINGFIDNKKFFNKE
ncbi:MAG: hypothetical protein LBS02_03260 [Hungatella sp.]|nr:hypothetical protein [Hungatella sp.]